MTYSANDGHLVRLKVLPRASSKTQTATSQILVDI
jgi:hypothetical protein